MPLTKVQPSHLAKRVLFTEETLPHKFLDELRRSKRIVVDVPFWGQYIKDQSVLGEAVNTILRDRENGVVEQGGTFYRGKYAFWNDHEGNQGIGIENWRWCKDLQLKNGNISLLLPDELKVGEKIDLIPKKGYEPNYDNLARLQQSTGVINGWGLDSYYAYRWDHAITVTGQDGKYNLIEVSLKDGLPELKIREAGNEKGEIVTVKLPESAQTPITVQRVA